MPSPTRARPRLVALAVAVLATGVLLASCRADDPGAADPADRAGADVSELLLPPNDVGASDRAGLRLLDLKSALQCGPETASMQSGVRSGDFARYDVRGPDVVLGVWPADDTTDRALRELAERLRSGHCSDAAGEPGTSRWGARPLALPGLDDVVAFSTVVRTSPDEEVVAPLSQPVGDAEQVYGARAYGTVADRAVSVQFDTTASAPIDPQRIADLWREQAERVRAEREDVTARG